MNVSRSKRSMQILAVVLVVWICLLGYRIHVERQRTQRAQARVAALADSLDQANREVAVARDELTAERGARELAERQLSDRASELQTARADLTAQLQAEQSRRVTEVQQLQSDMQRLQADAQMEAARVAEEIEDLKMRNQSHLDFRAQLHEVRLTPEAGHSVPDDLFEAFRLEATRRGVSGVSGAIFSMGDGYYATILLPFYIMPSTIYLTLVTHKVTGVWYDRSTIWAYFRDRYGDRAAFATFDMSLLDEMAMWPLIHEPQYRHVMRVVRSPADILGFDADLAPPEIKNLDLRVVKREFTDPDTDRVTRELVFYSHTRSGGVLHRNALRFDDEGRLEALDVTRLAEQIGDFDR